MNARINTEIQESIQELHHMKVRGMRRRGPIATSYAYLTS